MPTFNLGMPTIPAGPLKRLRVSLRPLTAVLVARASHSLVSVGGNLDHTLALKDWTFDIAEICGKSGRRSERVVMSRESQVSCYTARRGQFCSVQNLCRIQFSIIKFRI